MAICPQRVEIQRKMCTLRCRGHFRTSRLDLLNMSSRMKPDGLSWPNTKHGMVPIYRLRCDVAHVSAGLHLKSAALGFQTDSHGERWGSWATSSSRQLVHRAPHFATFTLSVRTLMTSAWVWRRSTTFRAHATFSPMNQYHFRALARFKSVVFFRRSSTVLPRIHAFSSIFRVL